MTASKIILIALGAIFLWLALIRLIRKLYHFPAPAFIGWALDSDFRRWFQPSDKVIERSGIKSGMTVMEFGCGSGAFTSSIAREVGERGKSLPLISNRQCCANWSANWLNQRIKI